MSFYSRGLSVFSSTLEGILGAGRSDKGLCCQDPPKKEDRIKKARPQQPIPLLPNMKLNIAVLLLAITGTTTIDAFQPPPAALTLSKGCAEFASPIRTPTSGSTATVSAISAHRSSTTAMHASMKPYIEKLIDGEDLSSGETEAIFSDILKDDFDPVQVGSLLMLLRSKGEKKDEVAGMVRAMNKGCNAVSLPGKKLLDIVGTGGDGADTINISTAR